MDAPATSIAAAILSTACMFWASWQLGFLLIMTGCADNTASVAHPGRSLPFSAYAW
jgi:hypothetical protein